MDIHELTPLHDHRDRIAEERGGLKDTSKHVDSQSGASRQQMMDNEAALGAVYKTRGGGGGGGGGGGVRGGDGGQRGRDPLGQPVEVGRHGEMERWDDGEQDEHGHMYDDYGHDDHDGGGVRGGGGGGGGGGAQQPYYGDDVDDDESSIYDDDDDDDDGMLPPGLTGLDATGGNSGAWGASEDGGTAEHSRIAEMAKRAGNHSAYNRGREMHAAETARAAEKKGRVTIARPNS